MGMTMASGETTTTASTRAFVDAMIAHNAQVRAEIERAAAGLATAGITGAVLDGVRELAGHYDGARGRWDALGAALKQHEALAEQARATAGAATDMSFYTSDDSGKDTMTTPAGSAAPADAGHPGELPDEAGLASTSSEHWHGSETVAGDGGTVSLGLYQQPDTGPYVVVATNPADKRWEPDSNGNGIDPALSPQEAEQFADALDELAVLAQSGAQTTAPTQLEKVAARVRGLLGDSGVTIVGDEGEIEVSAADIRMLLDAAAPEPAVATRRKIYAGDCDRDGFDNGTVWAELDTSGAEPVIAVTSTEGKEQPEDYPKGYTTTRLSLDEAGQLAGKVRRFAQTTPPAAAAAQPEPPAAAPAPQPAAPAQTRRVISPRGRTYEYDPATGATAVIEPDGWRAVVPPSSTTGIAARLLYWRAEIQDGRGDGATVEAGRELLAGLSGAELRELADSVGTSATGARTKAQLVDAIVNMTIGAPLKAWP